MEPLKLVTQNYQSDAKKILTQKLGTLEIMRLVDAAGISPESVKVNRYKNLIEIDCTLYDKSIVTIALVKEHDVDLGLRKKYAKFFEINWTWFDTTWFIIGVGAFYLMALFLTR